MTDTTTDFSQYFCQYLEAAGAPKAPQGCPEKPLDAARKGQGAHKSPARGGADPKTQSKISAQGYPESREGLYTYILLCFGAPGCPGPPQGEIKDPPGPDIPSTVMTTEVSFICMDIHVCKSGKGNAHIHAPHLEQPAFRLSVRMYAFPLSNYRFYVAPYVAPQGDR